MKNNLFKTAKTLLNIADKVSYNSALNKVDPHVIL